jgi:hypothetical protein
MPGQIISDVALTLTTGTRNVQLSSRALIVWLDETGHEEFADSKFPVFGLGGCAVLAGEYANAIALPWRELKKAFFGDEGSRLHASRLRHATPEQLGALSNFFNQARFARVAAVTRRDAKKPDTISAMQLIATDLRPKIEALANDVFSPVSDVVLIFEESERLVDEVLRNFSHWRLKKGKIDKPIEMLRAGKDIAEPGHEVADIIMQAAGGQARLDIWPSRRRDFNAIFNPSSLDDSWVKFLQIMNTELHSV